MAAQVKGNAVVGQSGGPTGVINQSLVGVIQEVHEHACIENLYGAVHAVRGIIEDDFVDLKKLSAEQLEDIAGTPSAALGSSRDKPDEEYCNKIFEVFKKKDVRYFYYIGGNDSSSTAHIVGTLAQKAGYDLKVFHVPKTVDNDLMETDHCPGYGTAATFVAQAIMGDDQDNRSLPGIKIDVIMGRHAGFLTAASALARQREDDGPHLIYVPERPLTMDKFVEDVLAVYEKLGRCVVAVSEGIADVDHTPWATKMVENAEKDAHGNVQLSGSGALGDYLVSQIKKALPKGRVRADTFGYLQRSFPGIVSPSDATEARMCGRMAVRHSIEKDSGSVAMKRTGDGANYGVDYFLTDLENVAAKTKVLADEYLAASGNDVTDAFIRYAQPLAGPLPKMGFIPR